MKSIRSLVHSVLFQVRGIVSKPMAASKGLTADVIEALRKKMADLAKNSEIKKDRPKIAPPTEAELENYAIQEESELKKQAEREKFAEKVFKAIKEKKSP